MLNGILMYQKYYSKSAGYLSNREYILKYTPQSLAQFCRDLRSSDGLIFVIYRAIDLSV